MAGEIEDDEQISGEKRRLDGAQCAGMPNSLVPLRLKCSEALAAELTLGAGFGKR
jgi:hypothetical protein